MIDCPFCNTEDVVLKNELAYAKFDRYPVNPGHILLITRRHVADYFDTTLEERLALDKLLFETKAFLDKKYHPNGYNVGVNIGHAAGQTIIHVHIHLIPRYERDVANPRGGVRGVIPDKREY